MVVPKGWSVDKIAKQFDLFAGGDVDKFCYSAYKTDVYCYPIYSNSLNNFGLYGYTSKAKYSSNSITITGRGFVGVAMFRNKDFDAIIRLLVLTPKNNKINCRFVAEYINQYIDFPIESTGVPQLTIPQIKDINIILPPLPEQQSIAEALSDIDKLIHSLEKLIDKKKAIKQGAMQELLTGKKRLDGFTGEWVEKPCGELLTIGHGQNQAKVASACGEYPILGTGGEMGKSTEYLYDKESVLIGRKGTIDKPRYINKPFWTIDTLFYTKIFDNVSAKFLFYKFCMIDWMSYNEASGVPSLSSKRIESIKIFIPDTKEEQTAIATILSDMDREIDALAQKLCKCRTIKQGMMQELLTGRIRLV